MMMSALVWSASSLSSEVLLEMPLMLIWMSLRDLRSVLEGEEVVRLGVGEELFVMSGGLKDGELVMLVGFA